MLTKLGWTLVAVVTLGLGVAYKGVEAHRQTVFDDVVAIKLRALEFEQQAVNQAGFEADKARLDTLLAEQASSKTSAQTDPAGTSRRLEIVMLEQSVDAKGHWIYCPSMQLATTDQGPGHTVLYPPSCGNTTLEEHLLEIAKYEARTGTEVHLAYMHDPRY